MKKKNSRPIQPPPEINFGLGWATPEFVEVLCSLMPDPVGVRLKRTLAGHSTWSADEIEALRKSSPWPVVVFDSHLRRNQGSA